MLIALPSWARGWSVSDLLTDSAIFSAAEQDLLASVSDTIIPGGNSIGALAVAVDKFLLRLIESCYSKEVQDNVKTQLMGLETAAQVAIGKSFVSCDQMQRQELLMKLSVSENKPEKDFFDLLKSETIRGFNTSKEVMQDYLKYKVVPGHYYGCVDVNA